MMKMKTFILHYKYSFFNIIFHVNALNSVMNVNLIDQILYIKMSHQNTGNNDSSLSIYSIQARI